VAYVQTVLGRIDPSDLGVTLPHEHTQCALWHVENRWDYWQLTRDEAVILDWQRDPTTRRFARNPAVPSAEEHHRWFAARLADPDCLPTVITLDGAPAGVLRLDPLEPLPRAPQAPAFEVSILVAPQRRGLGIAPEALGFLRRWQAAAVIVAEVLPGNEASAALFRAAGYRPGDAGLLYSDPAQSAIALSR